ncbi:response regulator [Slackia sp.]
MEAVAGSQALEEFTNVKPDLVILDIMMPGLDGFEVRGLGYRLGD